MKKVIWISSYLPRAGGIAYYSESYIKALREYAKKRKEKLSIKIIAHTDANKSDYPIIDLKSKGWYKDVVDIIKKEKPNIIHIQHEYGLYEAGDENQGVIKMIDSIKELNIPVVITYHSVYKKLEANFAYFMSETLKRIDAGIVHEDYQEKNLEKNIGWKPKNVYVLPHGSKENVNINREEARRTFGYNNELIVGSAGLADERKGFITLIKQWPKVTKKIPNAILVLELKPHFNKETRNHIVKVLNEIMKSPVSDNIEFSVKNYSKDEFYRILKSFDILVLPYESESQSGVLAHGFSAHTPAIVTAIEGLESEIKNSKAGISVKERGDFYKAIIKLLKDKKLRNKFSRNAEKYVKTKTSWKIIAKKTFDIYEKFW